MICARVRQRETGCKAGRDEDGDRERGGWERVRLEVERSRRREGKQKQIGERMEIRKGKESGEEKGGADGGRGTMKTAAIAIARKPSVSAPTAVLPTSSITVHASGAAALPSSAPRPGVPSPCHPPQSITGRVPGQRAVGADAMPDTPD
eukprot:2738565-Rhodomonas_salina.1